MRFSIERVSARRDEQPCPGAYVNGTRSYWWGVGARWVLDVPDLPALVALSQAQDEDLIVSATTVTQSIAGNDESHGEAVDGYLIIYDGYIE